MSGTPPFGPAVRGVLVLSVFLLSAFPVLAGEYPASGTETVCSFDWGNANKVEVEDNNAKSLVLSENYLFTLSNFKITKADTGDGAIADSANFVLPSLSGLGSRTEVYQRGHFITTHDHMLNIILSLDHSGRGKGPYETYLAKLPLFANTFSDFKPSQIDLFSGQASSHASSFGGGMLVQSPGASSNTMRITGPLP